MFTIQIPNGVSILPTADPHIVDLWWNNTSGVVTVSSG